MTAYAIVVTTKVTDEAMFNDYLERVRPFVEAHGGRYLVRGGTMEVVQGEWSPGRLVVVEFESMDRARGWQNTEDYAQLKHMLNESSKTSVILIEGV